ncbi:Iron-dependent extradiol dioxygenase [Frankia sp. Hr75.2]|nr:Iron-dependent extradiol dioxygenase [Frankia sp. Hr75.2]
MLHSLGYLGLTTTDLDAWRRFATDVCGLAISPGSTDDHLLLRVDERAWRISVVPGDGAMSYVGWEVSDSQVLDEVERTLEAAGHAVKRDAELALERQVIDLLTTTDPAGNALEFFYGATVDHEPFVSPRGARFVTGEEGLGHAVLLVPDMRAAEEFYLDTLGFRVSDRAALGPAYAVFTHVNPRHHSLALLPARGRTGLHHFMLEVDELDSVGCALDRVLDGGAELTMTLGKHINDHMVSFYCRTPSDCEVEYGWNGRRVDPDLWTTALYRSADMWGHHRTHAPAGPPPGPGNSKE